MSNPYFITAIGTPLNLAEELHVQGLQQQLDQQFASGINGVLAAGTMGLMQLLSDATYRQLVEQTVASTRGRGEVMVGAGDASFARSRDRILLLNQHKIDGVAVLAPYFVQFDQGELLAYYRALADVSRAPIYLYDLPQRTRTKIELETVLQLSEHPNIKGIKVSDEPGYTRQLADRLAGSSFRVIIAQPDLMDVLIRHGLTEHLDGMFAAAPEWTVGVGRAALAGNWAQAAAMQQKVSQLKQVFVKYGVFRAFTAVMNARGVEGNLAPAPYRALSASEREQVLAEPIVRELVAASKASRTHN